MNGAVRGSLYGKERDYEKNVSTLICFFLSVTVLLSAVSCTPARATELSGGYKRNHEESVMPVEGFEQAAADFSLTLLENTLSRKGENTLISPLSALLCLALVANGSDGNTRAQMEAAFGMNMEALNPALYAFMSALSSNENCQFKSANSIWFNDREFLTVHEDFLQTNAEWYAAEVYKTPFTKSTADEINGWVKDKTDGMIDSILKAVRASDVLYLLNALTFDAKWVREYEKSDVREKQFTNYGGNAVKVDMMYSHETLLRTDKALGFAKEYWGGAYSFAALLPEEGIDIYDFAADLDGEDWLAMWNSRGGTARAGLPQFSYDTEMVLNEALMSMGMNDMFDGTVADFSRMAHSERGNIFCSEVRQKTFIEVNTDGTRAAAATIAIMKDGAMDIVLGVETVILNRPFVYAIVDNATGLPLFLGIVAGL